jgi:hypothetical protein
MATIALPIRELEQSVRVGAEKAQAETELVATYSNAARASMGNFARVVFRTVGLKLMLAGLVRHQEKLISSYQQFDFTGCSDEGLSELAVSLDKIVEKERAILSKAKTLGSEIRVWWEASLLQLEKQAEHLDSIAESLHAECDDEASSLLVFAAEQFTMNEASQLAMK